jgi:hypothetical protein
MAPHHQRLTVSILVCIFLTLPWLGACRKEDQSQTGNDAVATAAAQTVQANALQSTLIAQSVLLTAQAGSAAQAPVEPQPAQPQATEPPASAPQTELPTIIASVDTNCRAGPGADYPQDGYLGAGEQSTVYGKEASGNWWYIENPRKPGAYCWVWAETTQVSGDTTSLPLIDAPPLPAPQKAPAQTEPPDQGQPPEPVAEYVDVVIKFANVHACGDGSYAIFYVDNQGGIDITSMDLVLQEQDTHNLLAETKSNAPFLPTADSCMPGSSPLKGGDSAFIAGRLGGQFLVVGLKVDATITLCSQPNQVGKCASSLVKFTVK